MVRWPIVVESDLTAILSSCVDSYWATAADSRAAAEVPTAAAATAAAVHVHCY